MLTGYFTNSSSEGQAHEALRLIEHGDHGRLYNGGQKQ